MNLDQPAVPSTVTAMAQALSERGYIVMDREEYDSIRAENAENESLRAVEQAARNLRWIDHIGNDALRDELTPLARALDDLDALRGK